MTYEKHKLTTDALDTLGSIIDESEKRDAIHLAVIPAMANHRLLPGDHVTFEDELAERCAVGQGVGIVDPFLETAVQTGEIFWLVVYPRQISSLRHVWEHPAFPPSGETDQPVETKDEPITSKAYSEQWLRDWLSNSELSHVPFEGLIEAIETGEWADPNSDYSGLRYDSSIGFTSVGYDAYGQVPPQFWAHVEAVVGRPIASRDNSIGCTC